MTGLSLALEQAGISGPRSLGPLTPDDGDQGWGRSRGQAGSPVRGVSPGHTSGAGDQEGVEEWRCQPGKGET